MRNFFISLIALLVLYFFVGHILIESYNFDWISDGIKEFYKVNASFTAGLASIMSLFAFTLKPVSYSTLEREQREYIQRISKIDQELQEKVRQSEATQQEIQELTLKQQVIENSIKKASQVIFLKDQLERKQAIILKKVESDAELNQAVFDVAEINESLVNLKIEINEDDNKKIIETILDSTENVRYAWLRISPSDSVFEGFVKTLLKFTLRSL